MTPSLNDSYLPFCLAYTILRGLRCSGRPIHHEYLGPGGAGGGYGEGHASGDYDLGVCIARYRSWVSSGCRGVDAVV